MAKKSSIEKNNRRTRMAKQQGSKRASLKAVIMNRELSIEERFDAQLKIAAMPRNGAKIRQRNRCELSGRPRGFYRKFKMSRIALRESGNFGLIPGIIKASW